jgi:putative transposase
MPRVTDPLSVGIMAQWANLYKDSSKPTMKMLYELAIGSRSLASLNEKRVRRGSAAIPSDGIKSLAEVNAERAEMGHPPLAPFSRSTFERCIRAMPEAEIVAGREGIGEARRRFKVSGIREFAVRPGQRVIMDCWKTQLIALKLKHQNWAGVPDDLVGKLGKLRLHLCVAIDEATRVVLGAQLAASASSDLAAKTLEWVCKDKSTIAEAAGCRTTWEHRLTPEFVATDSGSEFIGENFRFRVNDIGANYEIGPASHPDARGVVERCFRSIDLGLMQAFQGRTFSTIAEKGDYNPGAVANVTADILSQALIRFIVDVYHNSPHSGLGGETPNDRWQRLTESYQILPPPSANILRSVFGFSDRRQIQHRGIRFLGNWYSVDPDHRLAKLRREIRQKDVEIRVDLSNLGSIAVRRRDDGTDWFFVKCDLPEMEGLSVEQWAAAMERMKARVTTLANLRHDVVIEAIEDIRRLGHGSARAQGIAPSTMTKEDVRALDRSLMDHHSIVIADTRGTTFNSVDTCSEAQANGTATSTTSSVGVAIPDPIKPTDVTGSPPASRRRSRSGGFSVE